MVVDYCLSKELSALQSCKKNSLYKILIDSWWTPDGLLVNSWWTPWQGCGLHQEFTRSPSGVSGLYQDSWWTPSGFVGECNLQRDRPNIFSGRYLNTFIDSERTAFQHNWGIACCTWQYQGLRTVYSCRNPGTPADAKHSQRLTVHLRVHKIAIVSLLSASPDWTV